MNMTHELPTNTTLKQALKLAENNGWSVLPINSEKRPLVEWKKHQSEKASAEIITDWFRQFPEANLGVVTGKVSGLVVIDIDPRHGGKNTLFEGIETVIVKTGGGGWHYYFEYEEGLQNQVEVQPGIDIRAEGGYVVSPPSSHSSGQNYIWLKNPDEVKVAPLPDFVKAWLTLNSSQQGTLKSKWSSDILEGVGEGGRNDAAASVIGKLLKRFREYEWETEAWELFQAWNERNQPPLGLTELRAVFESISAKERLGQTRATVTQTPQSVAEEEVNNISLEQALESVEKALPGKRDQVLLVMATCISHLIDAKTPLWLMFVGVPSSAKTEIARMIGFTHWVFFLDAITENAFVSGSRSDQADLLPILNGKCLVVKDFTTTLSQREEVVRKILGDLTSIYDDSFVKHSPSRGTIEYHSFFAILGCVTPQALNRHQRYMNQIGPRFMFYRMPSSSNEEVDKSLEVLWSGNDLKKRFAETQKQVSAYCTNLLPQLGQLKADLEKESNEAIWCLNHLAKFIARARGMVITRSAEFINGEGEKIQFYEPVEIQIEEPFRALQQLRVLVRALAIVQQKKSVGVEELRIAKDVALSSMPADRSLLLSVILTENKEWSAKEISQALGISHRTALRQMDELVSLKILIKREQGNGLSNLYCIEHSFSALLYDTTEFVSHLPVVGTVTETPQRTVEDMPEDEIFGAFGADETKETTDQASQLSLEEATS